MTIAVTGGTGFLGRYVLRELATAGHSLRCWHRPESDRGGLEDIASHITWVEGNLGDTDSMKRLVEGCDGVMHAALDRPGRGFIGGEGPVPQLAERNVVGTLRLIEAARAANIGRFVFVSTCAVHDVILNDRPLDEAHPTWAKSAYGAHKAAIENFIHAYGFGKDYAICAIRPCGIYGVAHPPAESKWFQLISDVVAGREVNCTRGGKEVHAADVAAAIRVLLAAPSEEIAGHAFNCCDMYVADYDLATLAREAAGSKAKILGQRTSPRHTIDTAKLRSLGFEFGGEPRLRQTVEELVRAVAHPK